MSAKTPFGLMMLRVATLDALRKLKQTGKPVYLHLNMPPECQPCIRCGLRPDSMEMKCNDPQCPS